VIVHRGAARSTLGLLAVAAQALCGCRSGSDLAPLPGPPGEFTYAYASPDCAPWDGRAVSILLTTRPADPPDDVQPQLRLSIYPREVEIAGRTYAWPADPEVAMGSRCTAEGCQPASAGEIRLGPAQADSAFAGSVTLRFGAEDSVSGSFRAIWRGRRVLCG
jgi:hypothetical protein